MNNKTIALLATALTTATLAGEGPERNAYFGDTHIHTKPVGYFWFKEDNILIQ